MIYTLNELSSLISPVANKYNLNSVYLFGSYARNEADENSDIDILIDREGSLIKSLFDMSRLYNDLTNILQKNIDLVTIQTLNQKTTRERKPQLVYNIEKEKIRII